MEPDEHVAALEREGGLLASAAGRRGLSAPVPACPGWQVRDLLRHLGYVHRWAAGYVSEARQEMIDDLPENEILRAGPADDGLLGWFRDGLSDLVAVLRSADPGLTCWTFFAAPTPLAFWARRQAHETAIHRADVQGAAGGHGSVDGHGSAAGDGTVAGDGTAAGDAAVTPFPAAFAADGIDELLTGFAPRAKFRADNAGGDEPPSLQVRATDTGDEWHAVIGQRVTARRGAPAHQDAAGQCVLWGPASDLYLLLWNRQRLAGPVTISGDAAILDLWRSRIQVTW